MRLLALVSVNLLTFWSGSADMGPNVRLGSSHYSGESREGSMLNTRLRGMLVTTWISVLALVLAGLLPAGSAGAALPPDEVTVTSVSPTVAAAGASVSVSGTGFSTLPAENSVTVNGKTAAVTDSTTTSLQATLPTGATSGPVTVTTASGSATSTTDVFVPPTGFVPADVVFTARSSESGVTVAVPTAAKVGCCRSRAPPVVGSRCS